MISLSAVSGVSCCTEFTIFCTLGSASWNIWASSRSAVSVLVVSGGSGPAKAGLTRASVSSLAAGIATSKDDTRGMANLDGINSTVLGVQTPTTQA